MKIYIFIVGIIKIIATMTLIFSLFFFYDTPLQDIPFSLFFLTIFVFTQVEF